MKRKLKAGVKTRRRKWRKVWESYRIEKNRHTVKMKHLRMYFCAFNAVVNRKPQLVKIVGEFFVAIVWKNTGKNVERQWAI